MKNYVLIMAKIPDEKNIKDGMVMRELAIDNLFSNINKVYVQNIENKLTFFRQPRKWIKCHFFQKNKHLSKYLTNNPDAYLYVSKSKFFNLCKNATYIYVHSLHMLNAMPVDYIDKFKDKIILDIHGCVVEESEYYGYEKSVIENFQKLEEFAFPKINTLISVTKNMINFYKSKYPDIKTNFIQLPIYTEKNKEKIIKNKKEKLIVVYSGGTQKWQNIDLLCTVIEKIVDKFNIVILTPDIQVFTNKLGKISDKITLKTVSPDELYLEYNDADFGFILRDNIIVNQVACPTKLIEYLEYGIIPIILEPNIGDFENLGYSYIKYNDLLNNNIPAWEDIEKMRENNFNILNNLRNIQENGKEQLLKIVQNGVEK